MKEEKRKFVDVMNGAFYSRKPIRVRGSELVYNDGKDVEANRFLFTENLKRKVEILHNETISMAKRRNMEIRKNPDYSSSFPNDIDSSLINLMEMMLIIYEKISTTLAPVTELEVVRKKIEESMKELKQVMGKEYNKFLAFPFVHLNEKSPRTKMIFQNLKTNGLRKLTTENFELLFDKFFDQDTDLSRERGAVWMASELIADKKVIDFLIDRKYVTKDDVRMIVSLSKSAIYENVFYGGRLWLLGKDAPRLTGKKKKLHIKEYCHPAVFGNMYKEGKISLKELSEILSHNEILSMMYHQDVDEVPDEVKKDVEEIRGSYFSGDEIVELFKSKEYKESLREELSHIIWYRYVSGLFSVENLRELSQIKFSNGNRYFKLNRLAEFYNDLENHPILNELEEDYLKPEPVKAFFTFDEIAQDIDSGDEDIITFLNTSIRSVYENDGIDFEGGIINAISKSENKNERFSNLYENDIIDSSKLLETGIPKEDLIELYKRIFEKGKQESDAEAKREYERKAKELLYEMSKSGVIDFIDVMDIVEQTVEEFNGNDDNEENEINYIFRMVNSEELSPKILLDYYKDDDKDEVTETLFRKHNEEIFSNQMMNNLQELFSYDMIQKLYNVGEIDFSDLKEILGIEKAKEIDQRYDIIGKINSLIENGGIIGIEPEHFSSGTGKKRIIIDRKKKAKGENYDKEAKEVFLEEIHNLDKENGAPLEEPRVILLNSPVFDGFVLKPYPQFGIGIMEALETEKNSQNSSMVVRLKEVLEAVQVPKKGEKINTSENTLIGKAKSRTAFRLDNPGIVLRVYHTKNWGRNILKACKELATNNSEYFRRALGKSKDESERINEMRVLLQYLSENYEENLKKKNEHVNGD